MSGRDTALARAKIMKGALLLFGTPEVSIEVQEGRPSYGGDDWNYFWPTGVTSHHIASTPTVANPTPGLALVKSGRSDLPGPLANGTAGVDLVYRILTLGMANHPGYGGPMTLRGPLGAYTIPKDNGRAYLWGTEYEGGYSDAVWDATYTNRRTGKSMTFREFMGRCNAGLAYGIWLINGHNQKPERSMDLSGYTGEHKTWAPTRKIDRLNYTTDSGRAEVRRYAQEDDMPTPKELWDYEIPNLATDEPADTIKAGVALAQSHKRSTDAQANSARALAQARRNRDALRRIAENLPDKVAREVMAALTEEGDDGPEPTA